MMEVAVTAGAIRRAKLQSVRYRQLTLTNTKPFPCLSVANQSSGIAGLHVSARQPN